VSRWPSHFTPAKQQPEPGADDARLTQVLDLFSLGDLLVRDSTLAAGVDTSGRLQVASPRDADRFFEAAHQQLVLHQVATPAGPRHLALDGLWLFDLQLVEQVTDAGTLNDPVFLYGTLYGPVRGPAAGPLAATNGQLAVTRADVLEAFVRAQPFGSGARPGGGPSDKSFGLLLPGEADGALERGEGFVLALPVPPPELADTGGNGAQVRLVVHQVLAQVQADLAGRKRSMLSKLFVSAPQVACELHAPVEELVRASRLALSLIDGWPAPRVRHLFSRVGPPRSGSTASPPPLASRPVALPAPPRTDRRDDDWMKDFLQAHAAEGRPPARVTVATPARGQSAWMADFEAPAEAPAAPSSKPAAAPSTRPDWMKDFE
jgi:hypothetical protein